MMKQKQTQGFTDIKEQDEKNAGTNANANKAAASKPVNKVTNNDLKGKQVDEDPSLPEGKPLKDQHQDR